MKVSFLIGFKFDKRITIIRDLILCILIFFLMVQNDRSVPRNLEIRMQTKILSYPQNQLELMIKYTISVVYIVHKIKNDKRVTNS